MGAVPGPSQNCSVPRGYLCGQGIFRAQGVGLARWGWLVGRGFPGPAPCPGEAPETGTRPDGAPPQCSRGVGCLAVGLSGRACLASWDWPGRPGLWRGWRRRVPRPARPRCRLRGRSLGTGLRGDSRPDWRTGVEGQKRTRPDTAKRLRERTEQVKVRGRQHVLAKPPESGHRGQGLRPGDGVQTRPLPTQPLK